MRRALQALPLPQTLVDAFFWWPKSDGDGLGGDAAFEIGFF